LAATCGPSSSGDCCASSVVPAGSFYRGYDGTNFTSTAYPATVSDFRLDTYEITVGRFRKFAAAFKQTMIAQGAGKNPNDAADTGWSTTWNTHLDASAAALTSALECGTYATWTDTVGAAAHESQPLNCLNWFEAEAFCIWDGGRLPTEAEWNYAASAGSEQRVFPWGNTTPGPNSSLEIYGCYFSGLPTCTGSTDIAPVGLITGGNGKWGQADLAGNVEEWVRDAYGAYPLPCTNCSAGPSQVEAVLRGGSFFTDVTTTYASARDEADPGTHYLTYGARCARNP
jgi:formylglycine-generating enzyme required for sulfatase activity